MLERALGEVEASSVPFAEANQLWRRTERLWMRMEDELVCAAPDYPDEEGDYRDEE